MPDTTAADQPLGSPWEDLRAFVAVPRLGALTLSPDGETLVVSVSAPSHDQTRYVSALWRVDPHGVAPARRLTRSLEGEAAAAFLPDQSLLFTSQRAVPAGTEPAPETVRALWCLPAAGGEAYPVAQRDGGWGQVLTARRSDQVVLQVRAHLGTHDEESDAARRQERKKNAVAALWHTGSGVRHWDADLGPEAPRLLTATVAGGAETCLEGLRPLSGDVGQRLAEPYSLSDDASVLVTGWTTPRRGGVVWSSLALWSPQTGERRVLESPDREYGSGLVSPDGRWVVAVETEPSTPERAPRQQLVLVDTETLQLRALAADWDRWVSPAAWSPDSQTVYLTGDEDGDHPVFALAIDGSAPRRLTGAGAYGSVQVGPDGSLYAVRSSYTDPGSLWRIDPASGEQTRLPSPVDYPALPGRVERVETTAADGARVPGYLVLPRDASPERPATLALWIHGGPLSSWSSWSWRWCPWLLVSRGYAVLLPDPALSTGYGWDMVQRGWGAWGAAPYTDLMSITDAVEARDDIDARRTVAMGGSFGGYMANWVAGHTDRFAAIVSHASLWNLESFGATTDHPWYWARQLSPEMQVASSPHRFADQIRTPVLVIHGDRDYRVPIGEGLALWWALVSGFDGEPEQLPHRFLYFPNENHWVLTPNHARVWYEAVLSFLATHVDGAEEVRPELL